MLLTLRKKAGRLIFELAPVGSWTSCMHVGVACTFLAAVSTIFFTAATSNIVPFGPVVPSAETWPIKNNIKKESAAKMRRTKNMKNLEQNSTSSCHTIVQRKEGRRSFVFLGARYCCFCCCCYYYCCCCYCCCCYCCCCCCCCCCSDPVVKSERSYV